MNEELKKQLMAEIEAALLIKLSGAVHWATLGHIAATLDTSPDTILRRAIPTEEKVLTDDGYVEGRIRYKELGLNPGKKSDRRYYIPDGLRMLKTPACVRRSSSR
jgi:hypothetical protein